ncbi:oxidoreductase [Flavihumibacter petaseus]|uniref:oxidoreductase n=1 Tax=Flavihumibacter petaseus TaxID=549295 RepID=UPI00061D11B5|nr:oxidoreductase [Flavihumibacter petaseus]
MKQSVKTGLIGFGMAGRVFHAPFVNSHNGLELIRISTSNPEAAALATSLYPKTVIVPDAQAIINDPDIELVIVATPNTSHVPLAKAAMEAGKHVILEKPFTITSADAEELINVSEATGRLLTVHHNRRFDGDFATVKKLLASGMLGRVAELKINYDRFRPELRPHAWREEDLPGSGILYDLGAHLIDQALHLFGWPRTLHAEALIQRPGGKVDDRFEIILQYDGVRVALSSGMLIRQPGPHFVIHGDKGTFVKYGMDPQENALKAGYTPQTMADWGKDPESAWGKINTTWQGMNLQASVETETGRYQDFFKNVAEAIRGEAALQVLPQQARDTIRIIEYCFRSVREKRTLYLE